MTQYEAVIGLEVHAELLTDSKMFCGCRVVDSVTAPPNSAVCPVCLGMPGMLPVINRRAVALAIRVGLALNCEIKRDNVFARKSYFYPDLPKGYQISQYELPLCENGYLDITDGEGGRKRIGIRRVHMEEDTGKLTHLGDGRSLVDYNRSGVPLLEIVSEPDMRSAAEVLAYATQLRQILRHLRVNNGDMEKGVIRFEANISVRPAGGSALNTRTEVKNLNSFRALTGATDFEIARQIALVEGGGTVVQQTLGWHEARQETFSQRGKEDAHDYRYFPEPDLPPLAIPEAWIAAERAALPELPAARQARYRSEYALAADDAAQLSDTPDVAAWFDALVAAAEADKTVTPQDGANWVLNALFALLNEHGRAIDEIPITPPHLVALISLVKRGAINSSTGREVLALMFSTGEPPATIVEARGLAQISDAGALSTVIDEIIASNPDEAARYRDGDTRLSGWFVGQAMRATRGKADPALVNRLLREKLGPN